jgi:hypothetical protein
LGKLFSPRAIVQSSDEKPAQLFPIPQEQLVESGHLASRKRQHQLFVGPLL